MTTATVSVPLTWDEVLRTPDRNLRRLLADRYRKAATRPREQTRPDTPPPTPDELAEHRATIADLQARARLARKRADEDQPARREIVRLMAPHVARLNENADRIYADMAAAYTARIRDAREVTS